MEHQHQPLLRKVCPLLNLSVLLDHDDAYRGTGQLQHYHVHLKEPALRVAILPSSLLHSTKMRMLLISPLSDDAKIHLKIVGAFREDPHPHQEELTLIRRLRVDLQNGRHST